MDLRRRLFLAAAAFFLVFHLLPTPAEARTRLYVVGDVLESNRYSLLFKTRRGEVLSKPVRAKLAGIKIIPEADKYVIDMLKWRIVGKDVSFTRNNIRRKKIDRRGNLLGTMFCSASGFGYSGGSAYYGYIFTKKGLYLNAYLISQGFAIPDSSTTDDKTFSFFQKLYKEARRNRVGAWKILDKRKSNKNK